ncbi:MAG: hypothetical protein FK734_15170 [Asgard group archaeon]|nr:hypothetical protein [Asgard group archaeon]
MNPNDDNVDDDFDDYEDEEEEEEWEYFEEEEAKTLRDRVSIKDILKLIGLFILFAGFFLYFRFWDDIASWFTFGGANELGNSRLLYLTLLLFPVLASLFIVGMVDVSKTFFIPQKETPNE